MENTTSYKNECDRIDRECEAFNNEQLRRSIVLTAAWECLDKLVKIGYQGDEVKQFIFSLPDPEEMRSSEDYYPENIQQTF